MAEKKAEQKAETKTETSKQGSNQGKPTQGRSSKAKASGTAGKETIGTITRAQVQEIAKTKMEDLNTIDAQQAARTIEGTARSMGIEVVD